MCVMLKSVANKIVVLFTTVGENKIKINLQFKKK